NTAQDYATEYPKSEPSARVEVGSGREQVARLCHSPPREPHYLDPLSGNSAASRYLHNRILVLHPFLYLRRFKLKSH
ncbi:hypothetical protein J6590_068868, partial [Homalodisca vitripennis]